MIKMFILVFFLVSPIAEADQCPWMPNSRIDGAYPGRAPWTTLVSGQGRCKFMSDSSRPSSSISLTQMVKVSADDAEKYVKTVGGGMAKNYIVAPLKAIGNEGVVVRQDEPNSRMLTLIGHEKDIVVMAQLSFFGGVNAEEQATAQTLTIETFTADTGGGLQLPSR